MDEALELNRVLVDALCANGMIHSVAVERAFRRVLRHHFLPGHDLARVYENKPVITHRSVETGIPVSSSSAPDIMARMLESLQVEPGCKVLEIGTGTGYNAALLAELSGSQGHVCTIDIGELICQEAHHHLVSAGYDRVKVLCGDGRLEPAGATTYDRIIVTAAASDVAPTWFHHLSVDGLLVMPWSIGDIEQKGIVLRRQEDRLVLEEQFSTGFMPLRGQFASATNAGTGKNQVNEWRYDAVSGIDLPWIEARTSGTPWRVAMSPSKASARVSEQFSDFQFFLAVQEPNAVAWLKRDSAGHLHLLLGVADPVVDGACFLTLDAPTSFTGWGNPAVAPRLEDWIGKWVASGRPNFTDLQLTIQPRA